MDFLGSALNKAKEYVSTFNAANLSGGIDVVVVRQPDGTYKSSPFHIRFGKLSIIRPQERIVDITINGKPVDIHMKVGSGGECFFVSPEAAPSELPAHLATSPIPSPSGPLSPVLPRAGRDRFDPNPLKAAEEGGDGADHFETPPVSRVSSSKNLAHHGSAQAGGAAAAKGANSPDSGLGDGTNGVVEIKSLSKWNWGEVPIPAGEGSDSDSETVRELHAIDRQRAVTRGSASQEATPMTVPEADGERSSQSTPRNFSRNSDTVEDVPELGSTPQSSGILSRIGSLFGGSKTSSPNGARRRTQSDSADEHQGGGIYLKDLTEKEFAERMNRHWAQEAAMRHAISDVELPFPPTSTPHMASSAPSAYVVGSTSSRSSTSQQPRHERLASGSSDDSDHESAAKSARPSGRHARAHKTHDDGSGSESDGEVGPPDVALSLCGAQQKNETPEAMLKRFEQHRIGFVDFCRDPDALSQNPDAVVRIGKQFYSWKVAAPIIMSMVLFQKPLVPEVVARLKNKHMAQANGGSWFFPWRRASSETSPSAPRPSSYKRSTTASDEGELSEGEHGSGTDGVGSQASDLDEEDDLHDDDTDRSGERRSEMRQKLLKLTSEQLASFNLKEGANVAEFTVCSKFQGVSTIICNIFLLNYNDKVVISDIDGTITKSDVMGHAAALFGQDWTHAGVAKLYSEIAKNGYKFLYLSSRSISHAGPTRGYLKGVRQDEYLLPDGPVLLSPKSLLASIHREVIERRPEVFKIACLRDIYSLFPDGTHPFYAGFGNRKTDEVSYKAVYVPDHRIFTIDAKSKLRLAYGAYNSSYVELRDLVDNMFPPLDSGASWAQTTSEISEFTDVSFWAPSTQLVSEEDLAALEANL